MLRNYLTIAMRSIVRQKGFAFINITGLSVGLLCSFFIVVWIADEISYDRFHKDGDRIFQVMRHMITDGQIDTWPSLGQPVAETIQAEYPEVEEITYAMLSEQFVLTTGKNSFREKGGYASPSFFKVFSFQFLKGDSQQALQDVSSIVITDRLARKLFGDDWKSQSDIIGRSIAIDHRKDFTIRGVLKDVPENSTIQFDVLLPARDFTEPRGIADDWYYMCFSVYAKLREGSSWQQMNSKIEDLFIRHDQGKGTKLFLKPFEDVRLYSTYKDGQLVGGRIDYIQIFSIVAIFVLLIACINFMNLATARSSRRAREIGVRKVVGAQRRMLIFQFIGESLAMTTISFLIAVAVFYLLLPAFNDLTAKHLRLSDVNVFSMLAISVLVGIFSGIYPALYLSSFNPVKALRSSFRQRGGTLTFRKALVVFQFTTSMVMIVATAGVYLQLKHLRNVNLGLNREGLLFLPREGALSERFDVVSQELSNQPGIAGITTSGQDPLNVGNNTTAVKWVEKGAGSHPIFFIVNAGYDYVTTMGMQLSDGRDFSRTHDDAHSYLVNEEAATLMGGDVVGKKISVYGDEGQIVGILKNFRMNSLYSAIDPTIVRFDPARCSRIYVRTEAGKVAEALGSIKATCDRLNPGYPLEYTFLDQVFEQTYRSEAIMGKLANIFAGMSVFISSLGLLGLTAFTVEQRTREVGIRKVLGASVTGIAALLSADFVKLVVAGVVIAIPLASYFMNEWLNVFDSRTSLPWWLFAASGLGAILLAIGTISFQSIKAAISNPVETLRSE